MTVTVKGSKIGGSIFLPPSKSISHRAVICAALAKGESRISPIAMSEDIKATIGAMKTLGTSIEWDESGVLSVSGLSGVPFGKACEVFCGESGSTLRFLIPLFLLTGEKTRFLGSERLLCRPQTPYLRLFKEKNVGFEIAPNGIFSKGQLACGEYELSGDVSSQFITGLLFALPLLDGDSVIKIIPPFESRSYVDITLDVLKTFGVKAVYSDENTIFVKGGQHYYGCDYSVDGDYSQLAFFGVAAAVAASGSVCCKNISKSSFQGDRVILSILSAFGAEISFPDGDNSVNIKKGELTGGVIDLADCPDLGPVLMVLAAFSKGETVIKNAGRLRAKESDRIAAMEEELLKLSVDISSTQDSVTIKGRKPLYKSVVLNAHNDHRIAMSLAVFSACLSDEESDYTVTIEGAECVAKSYPDFFGDFSTLGVEIDKVRE